MVPKNVNKTYTVFVDSDAFVAFVKKDDSNHKKAKQIFEKLQDAPITYVTSDYVFAEVVTVLSQKVNHEAAVAFIKNTKSEDSIFLIERINEKLEDEAIQIFISQTSKNVSFIDCVNKAIIREKQMDGIFSFDDDYKKNGIKLIESII